MNSDRRRSYTNKGKYEVKKYVAIYNMRSTPKPYWKIFHSDSIEGPWSYVNETGYLEEVDNPSDGTIKSALVIDETKIRVIVYESTNDTYDYLTLDISNMSLKHETEGGGGDYLGRINNKVLFHSYNSPNSILYLDTIDSMGPLQVFSSGHKGEPYSMVKGEDDYYYIISVNEDNVSDENCHNFYLEKIDSEGNIINQVTIRLNDYTIYREYSMIYIKSLNKLLVTNNDGYAYVYDLNLNLDGDRFSYMRGFNVSTNPIIIENDPNHVYVLDNDYDENDNLYAITTRIDPVNKTHEQISRTPGFTGTASYGSLTAGMYNQTAFEWNDWKACGNINIMNYSGTRKYDNGVILDCVIGNKLSYTYDGYTMHSLSGTNCPDVYSRFFKMHD